MENLLAIANGLEVVKGRMLGRLAQYNTNKGQVALLQFQCDKIREQLREIYNSKEYAEQWEAKKSAFENSSLGRFLNTSKGKSGFQILMDTKKSA